MTSFLAHYGVIAVFVLMAVDAIFPAASELAMVYGGALASGALAKQLDLFGSHVSGTGAFLAVAAAGVLGYQLGSVLGWWIGDRGGRPFLERRGRWLHLTPERLERAERWFDRWDDRAVLIGRVTPVARSFISIPAGVFKMPFWRYNALTLLGNGAWCFALAGVGWGLGASWHHFHDAFSYIEYGVVGIVVIGVAVWLGRLRRSSTIPRRGDPAR